MSASVSLPRVATLGNSPGSSHNSPLHCRVIAEHALGYYAPWALLVRPPPSGHRWWTCCLLLRALAVASGSLMAVDVDTHECVCTQLNPRPLGCLSRLPRPCSVVKVILQFCKENQLTQSFSALSSETQARHHPSLRCAFPGLSARVRASTQVTLNAVDNRDAFLSDVRHGRWDSVLPQARRELCTSAAPLSVAPAETRPASGCSAATACAPDCGPVRARGTGAA